jgi:hypothetical protein
MPRDLESERDTMNNLPELSVAPRRGSPQTLPIDVPESAKEVNKSFDDDEDIGPGRYLGQRRFKGKKAENGIHPLSSTLTVANVEECIALENDAFPEDLRASRAKV